MYHRRGLWVNRLTMRHPSRILFELSLLCIVVSVMYTFWNTMVLKNFTIVNDLEPDSATSDEEIPYVTAEEMQL